LPPTQTILLHPCQSPVEHRPGYSQHRSGSALVATGTPQSLLDVPSFRFLQGGKFPSSPRVLEPFSPDATFATLFPMDLRMLFIANTRPDLWRATAS